MKKQSVSLCFLFCPNLSGFYLTFLQILGIINMYQPIWRHHRSFGIVYSDFLEVPGMKKCSSKIGLIIGIVSIAAAVAAVVTAVLMFLDKKKKDEEELEHYLDCSIQ